MLVIRYKEGLLSKLPNKEKAKKKIEYTVKLLEQQLQKIDYTDEVIDVLDQPFLKLKY